MLQYLGTLDPIPQHRSSSRTSKKKQRDGPVPAEYPDDGRQHPRLAAAGNVANRTPPPLLGRNPLPPSSPRSAPGRGHAGFGKSEGRMSAFPAVVPGYARRPQLASDMTDPRRTALAFPGRSRYAYGQRPRHGRPVGGDDRDVARMSAGRTRLGTAILTPTYEAQGFLGTRCIAFGDRATP